MKSTIQVIALSSIMFCGLVATAQQTPENRGPLDAVQADANQDLADFRKRIPPGSQIEIMPTVAAAPTSAEPPTGQFRSPGILHSAESAGNQTHTDARRGRVRGPAESAPGVERVRRCGSQRAVSLDRSRFRGRGSALFRDARGTQVRGRFRGSFARVAVASHVVDSRGHGGSRGWHAVAGDRDGCLGSDGDA